MHIAPVLLDTAGALRMIKGCIQLVNAWGYVLEILNVPQNVRFACAVSMYVHSLFLLETPCSKRVRRYCTSTRAENGAIKVPVCHGSSSVDFGQPIIQFCFPLAYNKFQVCNTYSVSHKHYRPLARTDTGVCVWEHTGTVVYSPVSHKCIEIAVKY